MKKPCTRCIHAYHSCLRGKERWERGWHEECKTCKDFKRYEKELESRRKYTSGRTITDINDLIHVLERDTYVYWRLKILHRGWVESWQLHSILQSLNAGVFKIAIKKTEDQEEQTA